MQVCCCDLQMMTSPRLVEEGERSQSATAMLRLAVVNRTKPGGAVSSALAVLTL